MSLAKSIINALKKSVAMSELSQVEVPTQDFSMDELASKDCKWLVTLKESLKDCEFGDVPREIILDKLYKLYASQVDDGLYDGFVKNIDPESGDYGQLVFRFNKFTLPGMVQALKQKGYISDDQEIGSTEPIEIVSEETSNSPKIENSNVKEILRELLGSGFYGDVNITINKSAKEIIDLLKGGKPAAMGEARTHKDGITRKKTAQGWVPVTEGGTTTKQTLASENRATPKEGGAFDNLPTPEELKTKKMEIAGTVTKDGEIANLKNIDTKSQQKIKKPISMNLSDTPDKIVVGDEYKGSKKPGIGYSIPNRTLKPGMVINNFLMKRADDMAAEGVFSHKVKDGSTGELEEHRFRVSKDPSGSYVVKNIKSAMGQKPLTVLSGSLLDDLRTDIFAKSGTSDQDIVVTTTLINVKDEVMMVIAPIQAESADIARAKVLEFLDKKLGRNGEYSLMKFSSESGRNFRPALLSQAAVANYVKKSEEDTVDIIEAIEYFYEKMGK